MAIEKRFNFEIKDTFFNTVFNGETSGTCEDTVKKELLDWYAYELDTDVESLELLLFKEIN